MPNPPDGRSRLEHELEQVLRLRARLERQLHARRGDAARPSGRGPQRYDESGFPIRQPPPRMVDGLRRLLSS